MKNLLLSLLIATTTSFAGAGVAEAANCSKTSCVDASITRIYVNNDGVYYYVDGSTAGLDCTNDSNKYLKLKTTHPNYDAISRTALAMYLAGQRVWFRMEDNNSSCEIAYLVHDAK